jgi:pimeloyl-ACP methyl ester carboxylesterase
MSNRIGEGGRAAKAPAPAPAKAKGKAAKAAKSAAAKQAKQAAQPQAAPGDKFAAQAAAPAAAPAGAASVKGPYAELAKRGDFDGYVRTASGADVYVSIKLAKNAATTEPMVLLDGIAARFDRNASFEQMVQSKNQSIITVFLPGQGETLAKDMDKGGRSIDHDISPKDQAKAVVEVLDALGVKDPVGVMGLSYGGAIAGAAHHEFPQRFDKALLVAPFFQSEGKSSPFYDMMNHNPFNPFGPMMYREAAKVTLAQTFNYVPDVLQKYGGAFQDALFHLSMGLEDFELPNAVKGDENVHFLVVPGDTASNPNDDVKAFEGAKTGSFMLAPAQDAGKHDLIRGDGALVATWAADVMAGRLPAESVAETMKKAAERVAGQQKNNPVGANG